MHQDLPYEQPGYHKQGVGFHHQQHTITMAAQYQGQQSDNLTQVTPHIHIRSAIADGQVLIKRVDRHKGTAHTKHLQQRHALYPLLVYRDQDELARHQRQAEH